MSCGNLRPLILSPPEPAAPTVQSIMAASEIVAGWDAADLVASPVALWPDASGNGFDLVQAVAGSQPTWGAATGPNGQPAVLFDGVDDVMSVVLDLPAPGTTPSFFWAVLRQVTWTNNDGFWGADMLIGQFTASPQIFQFAGGGFNGPSTGLTVNVYKRLEAFFNDDVSDYLKAGASSVTGTNAGNTSASATFELGQYGGAGTSSNIQVCELWIFNVLPTPAQLAQLDAYALARYGPLVLT